MAIVYCLNDENLINWVEKELSGYDIEEKLPIDKLIQGSIPKRTDEELFKEVMIIF